MVIVLDAELAIARSSLPSPLRSPATIDAGLEPAGKVIGGRKVLVPMPRKIDTLLELPLVTARSRIPSELKSATASAVGAATVRIVCGRKVASPLFSNIETVPALEFATARSRRLS